MRSAADLYHHEYVWSHFFQRYPPDGGLLIGDLGAVAYFTDVPILDAADLGTVEMLPAHWSDPMICPAPSGSRDPAAFACRSSTDHLAEPQPPGPVWLRGRRGRRHADGDVLIVGG